ncbi:MAG: hypothetical protein WKF49_02965 [Thermoleophilaceae bacterium]
MPSPHRRIGLVVDEGVESALTIFRQASETAPDASLVRTAVLEGALIEALMTAAQRGDGDQEQAAVLVKRLRDLLPALGLPAVVRANLAGRLDRAVDTRTSEQRRHRQLELIGSPNPYGTAALDYADSFDADDVLPH